MTEYYIRITDEEPPEDETSLWFKLIDESGKDEFWVVHRNEYEKLKNDLNVAVTEFNNSEIVTDAIRNVFEENPDFAILNTINSFNLTDEDDRGKKYSYSSLTSSLNDLSNSIGTLSDEKVDNEIFDYNLNAQSTLNSELNTRLISLENAINGLEWKKTSIGFNGIIIPDKIFYNSQFVYIKLDFGFSGFTATGGWDLMLSIPKSPIDLTPTLMDIKECNNGVKIKLLSNGNMYFKTTKGTKYNFTPDTFFFYPRRNLF